MAEGRAPDPTDSRHLGSTSAPYHDPMGFERVLEHRQRLHALGFAIDLQSDHRLAIEIARCRFPPSTLCGGGPPVRLEVQVTDGEPASSRPRFNGRGHLLTVICDRSNWIVCDLETGYCLAAVTEATLRECPWAGGTFFDLPVYSILARSHCTALHAAAVSRSGHGLLLCARSGTGKSSLAYACAKQGWTFVSDDAVYLAGDSDSRVLGKPHRLRLKESASRLFPELAAQPKFPDMDGVPHFELDVSTFAHARISEECDARAVVFLDRQEPGGVLAAGVARIRPVVPEEARDRLLADLPSYGKAVRRRHADAVQRLVSRSTACELSYSDLNSAIHALEELVERSHAVAPPHIASP